MGRHSSTFPFLPISTPSLHGAAHSTALRHSHLTQLPHLSYLLFSSLYPYTENRERISHTALHCLLPHLFPPVSLALHTVPSVNRLAWRIGFR
jgi:hypothetical protein